MTPPSMRPIICAIALLLGGPAAALPAQQLLLSADTTVFAEGLDADPRTGLLYVTSIRHRMLYRSPRTGPLTPWLQLNGAARPGAVLGVAVDTARGRLWLTTANLPHMADAGPADTVPAELLRVRLADGVLERRWRLGTGRGVPGELALTPAGDVLVSDGVLGVLHRLPRGEADSLTTVTSPLLRSPQGIAVSADGAVAWVADWSRGLRRWTLATDAIVEVAAPAGETLRGLDGLRRHGMQLIGVQNGADPPRIVAMTLDTDGRAVTQIRTLDAAPMPGEPTVGTVLGGEYLWVASSHWPFHDDAGRLRGERGRPGVVLGVVRVP